MTDTRPSIWILKHTDLLGGDLEEGQFYFELTDYAYNILQVETNGPVDTEEYMLDENGDVLLDDYGEPVPNPWYGTAPVVFRNVRTYTEEDVGRKEQFRIYETADYNDDRTIKYESCSYIINVTVNMDEEGELYLTKQINRYNPDQYGVSDITFTNEKKPGDLLISKAVTGDENDEFTFELTLTDRNGEPLEGTYSYRKYSMEENNYIYHSDNIDDEGNMIEEMAPNGRWYEVWKTYENTDNIHIRMKFGGAGSMVTFGEGGELYFEGSEAINEEEFDLPDELYKEGSTFYMPFVYTNANSGGYGYYLDVTTQSQTTVEEGTYTPGDTITLKGGEYFEIKGLPDGTTYTVQEIDIPRNWTLVGVENDSGFIRSAETVEARFTNDYEYVPQEVSVQLEALKTMKAGILELEDSFAFQLEDEAGNILEVKTPDKYSTEEELVTSSPVTFDTALNFSEEDVGTYTYYISERIGQDTNVVYDKTLYEAEVTVYMNDEDILTADVVYKKVVEDGYEEVETAEFINEKYTDLYIEKIVDRWEDSSPVTFVFEIEAKVGDNIVYHDMESMTFDSTGKQNIRIEHLPSGAEVTVTEVYAGGSYQISDEEKVTQVIVIKNDKENENVVSFTNGYNDGTKRGYGAKNSYNKDDKGNWIWQSDLKEGGDES